MDEAIARGRRPRRASAGHRRPDDPRTVSAERRCDSGHRDDGLRRPADRRPRRRTGGVRVHDQALRSGLCGQRRGSRAGESISCAAERGDVGRSRRGSTVGNLAPDAAGLQTDCSRRDIRFARLDCGRNRSRQGTGGHCDSSTRPTQARSVRSRLSGRSESVGVGERTVRPRARSLHRRGRRTSGTDRTG